MTVFRCILPKWAETKYPDRRRVVEGQFSDEKIAALNEQFYNIYFLPNYPSFYERGSIVDGSQIDVFSYVLVDMDLKDGIWPSKDAFLAELGASDVPPTFAVDSGGGIHAYWHVEDLDAMSYLRLCRRLMRKFKTDPAVGQIYQLMRLPGTVNTKNPDDLKVCETACQNDRLYTCAELDAALPILSLEDEEFCKQHFDKTYKVDSANLRVDDKIPAKFNELLRTNAEVKAIWVGGDSDRSKSDYRLGHIMFATGFSRDEALSVLVNSAKAISRAPVHRVSYAQNIVDKIWTFEEAPAKTSLSSSVLDILVRPAEELQGTRFPCWGYLDGTVGGFRLGQVMGLVGGSGVGKSEVALNAFKGFVHFNPDYIHLFVPLEQPKREIAVRWQRLCGEETRLHDRVHILDNYNDDGTFRALSLTDIGEEIKRLEKSTGRKVGCVVVDHVGALKKVTKNGENQGLMDLFHAMKPLALETNTFLIMQSQAPREKAGSGDLELNKDAAYGSVFFESYCDYLMTIWQPLKRCYASGAPLITAYKFCKIRHKDQKKDSLQEDACYRLLFDPETGRFSEVTQADEVGLNFWENKAANLRKRDKRDGVAAYKSTMGWGANGNAGDSQNKG